MHSHLAARSSFPLLRRKGVCTVSNNQSSEQRCFIECSINLQRFMAGEFSESGILSMRGCLMDISAANLAANFLNLCKLSLSEHPVSFILMKAAHDSAGPHPACCLRDLTWRTASGHGILSTEKTWNCCVSRGEPQ